MMMRAAFELGDDDALVDARPALALQQRGPQVRLDVVRVLLGHVEPDVHVLPEHPRFVLDHVRRVLAGAAESIEPPRIITRMKKKGKKN